MQILPVIDLLDGHVVRGVAGRRQQYRPVRSTLAAGSAPAAIAAALAARGFQRAYVADLNAIMHGRLAVDDLLAVAGEGLALWLDAGLGEAIPLWPPVLTTALQRVIVAAETQPNESSLQRQLEHWGEQAVFSLDLLQGRPLGAWREAAPLDIAELAIDAGCRRLIVLDLAQVGVAQGPSTAALCAELRRRHTDLELTSGGGLRGPDDLKQLEHAGCDFALVASALHDGRM